LENMEFLLVNFPKENIEKFLFDELKINDAKVKTSYFFDKESGEDIEFSKIKSLYKILSPNGTGNIVLDQLRVGVPIADVVLALSFDEERGDVVFNFPEKELLTGDKNSSELKAKAVLEYLANIREKFGVEKIRIGYEPAADDDTCLYELSGKDFDLDSAAKKIANT